MNEVKAVCGFCDGSGVDPHKEGGAVCRECGGVGNLTLAEFAPGYVMTQDILAVVDVTELNALSAAKKALFSAVIGCGFVDIGEGSGIREKLEYLFEEGTGTRAALEELWS